MIYQYDEHRHTSQPRERQVGAAAHTQTQPPITRESAGSTIAELDELVERARWEMRHEPVRERGRGGLG